MNRVLTEVVSTAKSKFLRDMARADVRTIKRDARPLWYVRGWRKEGKRYFGFYRVGRLRWAGELVEELPGTFKVYIADAPRKALNGRHHLCFHLDFSHAMGGGIVHSVHESPPPTCPEEAINALEKILAESI